MKFLIIRNKDRFIYNNKRQNESKQEEIEIKMKRENTTTINTAFINNIIVELEAPLMLYI